ncbi:glycosyltransferase family 4 protein [Nibrella saemangeumensis]
MKIIFICNKFPPAIDGVGDYTFHLANNFYQLGHDVSVICAYCELVQQKVSSGCFNYNVFPIAKSWSLSDLAIIKPVINSYKPDWLLVQYVPNSFSRLAIPFEFPLLLLRIKNQDTRICITFHELYTRMVYWPFKHLISALAQRWICTKLAQVANLIVVSIDITYSLLQTRTDKPIHLIPIGSNILPFHIPDEQIVSTRNELAPNGESIISTFGNRDQDTLIQVFCKLVRKRPEVKLLICGVLRLSPEGLCLFDSLKDKIIITGHLPNRDVYRLLRSSDVFFLPDPVDSSGEGGTSTKSGSLAAALVAGLPVVGTSGHMNDKLLSQVKGLYLGDYTNPDELAYLILKAMEDKTGGKLNQEFASSFLAWEYIGKCYNDLLSK